MSKITSQTISSNTTFTPRNGVNTLVLTPVDSSGNTIGSALTVTVTNTSYTITINTSSYSLGTANTFGSIYRWIGTQYLKISWMD